MTGRGDTMRELLTAARERFGPDAARFKTRQELLDALGRGPTVAEPQPGGAPQSPQASKPDHPLVLKDFFLPPRLP